MAATSAAFILRMHPIVMLAREGVRERVCESDRETDKVTDRLENTFQSIETRSTVWKVLLESHLLQYGMCYRNTFHTIDTPSMYRVTFYSIVLHV